MSKKIRKWSDEYVQYGFKYITELDGSQRPQCTICDAKLSHSSLAPAKLKEHFLKMHGDGKYKNTAIVEFKIKRARYDEKAILPVFGFVAIDKTDPYSIVRNCIPDCQTGQTTHHWEKTRETSCVEDGQYHAWKSSRR